MKTHEKVAAYAYENSIFYREYVRNSDLNVNGINADINDEEENSTLIFEKLPFISKEDIVDSGLPLCPAKYLISNDEENVIKVSTSGSTGKIMEIEWNKGDYHKSMTELWSLRKKYYNIKPDDRMCFFYTIRKIGGDEALEYEMKHTLGFSKTSLNEERIKEVYERMLEYQPVWLLLQPSTAVLILNVAEKYSLPKIRSVRYIEFSGEMLTEGLKNNVRAFFECDVANQYGSYEFNSIAFECPQGNMHVMGSNVYVEAIDDKGSDEEKDIPDIDDSIVGDNEEKEFAITSLTNMRNPFIRYRIGDKGILKTNVICRCGNHNAVIELTVGRSSNYVECEDGTKLNAYIFARAVDNINILLDDVVKQFQVIQRAINDFMVRMYIDDRSQIPAIKEIFEENILDESLKNAEFEYCFEREYIKEEQGDKLMYFRRGW